MADSDLIILFYTPEVFASKWVHEEMTRANSMGLTVIQLIWPDVTRDERTELFYPEYLSPADFQDYPAAEGGPLFIPSRLDSLVALIESMRARALRSREVKLVDKICGLAREAGFTPAIQPGYNYIDIAKGTVRTRLCYTLGIPDSTNFETMIGQKEECFLYDSANIREDWRKHLDWLGGELRGRLTTITTDGAVNFLQRL